MAPAEYSSQDRLILPLSETHALILNRVRADGSFRVSINEKTGLSKRVTIVLTPDQAKQVSEFINGSFQVAGELGA